MALLFVFGVMNLAWIAALAVFVLLEIILRRPTWFVRAAGATLLGRGALLALQASARHHSP